MNEAGSREASQGPQQPRMTRRGAQVGALGTLEEKRRQEVSRQKQINMGPSLSGRWEAAGWLDYGG